jgi:redox-sensing transcriptional repressor
MAKKISDVTLKRIPLYLNYLKNLPEEYSHITAAALARAMGLGEVLVRKDLGNISGGGRPRTGYNRLKLIRTIEEYLGYDNATDAVLVGAGKLGQALMGYQGFQQYGMRITAAFDISISHETKLDGISAYTLHQLREYCQNNRILMGIIAVPANQAQSVADDLVAAGIKAIWCFSPVYLNLPEKLIVQYENMAASFAMLSVQLRTQLEA